MIQNEDTQKLIDIKVELKTQIPEGNLCRGKNAYCPHLTPEGEWGAPKPQCNLIHEEVYQEIGAYYNIFKHSKCLEASIKETKSQYWINYRKKDNDV